MDEIISMSYGNGGKKTSRLIEKIILPAFNNNELNKLGDGALLTTSGEIAFSTDSFVIYPYIFPGGDIGKLSVCGTVNDLIMCGSIPKFLSISLIIEEGFFMEDFESIIQSAAKTAKGIGVKIVTGDTKVVDKGHGGGIYINTAGIGEKIKGVKLEKSRIEKGDKIIITGDVGDHGVAILCAREQLLEEEIKSDCRPLYELVKIISKYGDEIKILRDPTRGGVATTLSEFIEDTNLSIELNEVSIPVNSKVKAACDMLGLDPLYSANEGKALMVVSEEAADEILNDLKKIDIFKKASIIGEVVDNISSKVVIKNFLGSRRILDKLSNDILPRIC
jgi:hydrogenase expression/formation protein HypE